MEEIAFEGDEYDIGIGQSQQTQGTLGKAEFSKANLHPTAKLSETLLREQISG